MEEVATCIKREVNDETLFHQIEEMKAWVSNQTTIPALSEKTLELFLHSCVYNINATKQTLLAYYKLRMEATYYFNDRDPCSEGMQLVAKSAYHFMLPGTTPEGYKVLLGGYLPYDENFNFKVTIKRYMMQMDMWLSKMDLCEGYVIAIDSQYSSLSHYTSGSLEALKRFITYCQEALPVRLKGIFFINISTTTNLLLSVAHPILSKKIRNLIQKFTQGDNGYHSSIPKTMLPYELGGEVGTISEWNEAAQKELEEYAEWFYEQDQIIMSLNEKNQPSSSKGFIRSFFSN